MLWHCASLCLLITIIVWMISYGLIKRDINKIEVNIIQKDTVVNLNGTNPENGNQKNKIKYHVPKFMLDLYEQGKWMRKEENISIPDVVRSVVPIHAESVYPGVLTENGNNDHHILVFKIPKHNQDEVFFGAQLRVLTRVEIKSNPIIGIERLLKISYFNETDKSFKTIEEKHIFQKDNSWISFNVTNIIKQILIRNKETTITSVKLVLTIKSFIPIIKNNVGVFKVSLMPLTENMEHDYPILLLFYKNQNEMMDNSKKRTKRSIDDDYEEETNRLWDDDGINRPLTKKMRRLRNACKKRPLYIDFSEIHYDTWIVQPLGYEAYQCAGKCFYPVAEHLSPTKHAIVQALLHSMSPSKAPRSCCVPTALESISILYVDQQGVLTYRYNYKDMVVAECGCR